jgi:hypothetical protein
MHHAVFLGSGHDMHDKACPRAAGDDGLSFIQLSFLVTTSFDMPSRPTVMKRRQGQRRTSWCCSDRPTVGKAEEQNKRETTLDPRIFNLPLAFSPPHRLTTMPRSSLLHVMCSTVQFSHTLVLCLVSFFHHYLATIFTQAVLPKRRSTLPLPRHVKMEHTCLAPEAALDIL